MAEAVSVGRQAAAAVANFYQANNTFPQNPEQAGFALPPTASSVQNVSVDPNNGSVKVVVSIQPHAGKTIVFVPSLDAQKQVVWHCGSSDINTTLLPQDCRE
jgi:hypothetical protein